MRAGPKGDLGGSVLRIGYRLNEYHSLCLVMANKHTRINVKHSVGAATLLFQPFRSEEKLQVVYGRLT
jgi:hypothetical protein